MGAKKPFELKTSANKVVELGDVVFEHYYVTNKEYPPHEHHILQLSRPVYLWRKKQVMINSQKQSTMFARVDEWKESGKTMQEFASGIGLSRSCFEYWIRKKLDLAGSSPQFV